ncbi:MAG: hypothetical protein NXH73_10085 [Flavobacteriaceae bacterium]|nr:hypothetical protein [Flavobacteriaceae bacterium]
METNNFDNQIKNQMEQRTVEPSPKSWEQLRSKLDKNDKKTSPLYWWISIAASFLVGILLMGVFVDSEKGTINNIVNEDSTEFNTEAVINPVVDSNLHEIENQETDASTSIVETKNEKPFHKELTNLPNLEKEKSAPKEEFSPEISESITQIESQQEKVIIDEIIANIKPGNEVLDDEIDALLNEALDKITTQKANTNPVITSSSLLEDVEGEIEESFRERIFELLKEGLMLSREAVANRNQ